jgi:hypothetical protein
MSVWKIVAQIFLTVATWELGKYLLKSLFSIEYFKRESDEVVIKVKVMPWDISGKKHFLEQGYSKEFPKD